MTNRPPPAKASTIVLYRLTPSPQLYMLKRSARSSFMPNALVFPGGRVEPSDEDGVWNTLSDLNRDDAADSLYLDAKTDARALMVAAVRETFEEAGILSATTQTSTYSDPSKLPSLRSSLNAGNLDFAEVVSALDGQLALRSLGFLSRWVTPEIERKRFDAFFFLADVTDHPGHATADGTETEHGRWIAPEMVLAQHEAKQVQLAPPTLRALEYLAQAPAQSWASLLRTHSEPICPQFVATAAHPTLVLPGDPLHVPPGECENRFVRATTHWESIGVGF